MKPEFLRNVVLAAFIAVVTTACGDGTEPGTGLPANAPIVLKMEPATALPGDEVTISGLNYGTSAGVVTVRFGYDNAPVVSVTDEQLKVTVPAPSVDITSPVTVFVTVGGKASNESSFDYVRPQITAIERYVGYPGEEIVLTGTGFNTDASKNKVFFGTTTAEVIGAAATSLTVKVPAYNDTADLKIKAEYTDYPQLASGEYAFKFDETAVVLAAAEWTVDSSLEGGIECRKAEFADLLGGKQTVSLMEIPKQSGVELGIGMPASGIQATSTICKSAGAFGGVNASFFYVTGSADYVRIGGKQVVAGRSISGDAAINGAVVLTNGNEVSFHKFTGDVNALAKNLEGDNVLVAGPVLVLDDKVQKLTMSDHNKANRARTAVGVKPDGTFMMVVVDEKGGRAAVDNQEMAYLMKGLGASGAMCLDGGGSTTLFCSSWGTSGVVNTPSDSSGGERAVANVIYAKKK